jgi:hypothetical protein
MIDMTIDNYDEGAARAENARPAGGIYSLPAVGSRAATARQFYDEMAPRETDSTEVRIAKEVLRWSSVVAGGAVAVAGAAAVAVVVL